MNPKRLSLKLFATRAIPRDELHRFIGVFHRFIQEAAVPGLLIDVADYAHVPAGPGTLLVSSEANLHMDRWDGRLGLSYVRKLPIARATSFRDRVRAVIAETVRAAATLEQEAVVAGRLKFRTDELQIRVHDRLLAPNTTETYGAVKGELGEVLAELLPGVSLTVEHHPDPLKLFEVRVKAVGSAPSLDQILQSVGTRAAAA